MTKKQQDKVLESERNCTFYDDINFKSEDNYTFKIIFFNAVLGRLHLGYTQQDAANYLQVSKRTIIELEKGNSNNLKLVLNYIDLFKYDFALHNKKRGLLKFKYQVI